LVPASAASSIDYPRLRAKGRASPEIPMRPIQNFYWSPDRKRD